MESKSVLVSTKIFPRTSKEALFSVLVSNKPDLTLRFLFSFFLSTFPSQVFLVRNQKDLVFILQVETKAN